MEAGECIEITDKKANWRTLLCAVSTNSCFTFAHIYNTFPIKKLLRMSVSSLISVLKLGTAMKVKISASRVSKLTMKIFTYLPKLKYCACAA